MSGAEPERRELERLVRQTWDDHALSRGERRALGALVADGVDGAAVRAAAFGLARAEVERSPGADAVALVSWLDGVVKATLAGAVEAEKASAPEDAGSEAWFAPHMDVCGRLIRAFEGARERADVCVFTITDDRITAAMIAAHRRGVALRVVSDDMKSEDLGSDIERLAAAGVPVRIDRTPAHMHHKFVLVDGRRLFNGSYNWTRSACLDNDENLVVSSEPTLVAAFASEFERQWGKADPVAPMTVVARRGLR